MKRLQLSIPAFLLMLLLAAPVAATQEETADKADKPNVKVEEPQDADADQEASEDEAETEEEPEQIPESLSELREMFDAQVKEHNELRKDARGDRAESARLRSNAPKLDDHKDLFFEFVDAEPTADSSSEALMWAVFKFRENGQRKMVVDRMLENFMDSEELAGIVAGIPVVDAENAEENLTLVIESSPHDQVKAAATYALFEHLNGQKDEADDEDALKEKLESLKTALAEKYADVEDSRGTTYGMKLEAIEFAARLEIGQPVPDIEGEDIEGVEFKLSEYVGKVVVIDFWGDW